MSQTTIIGPAFAVLGRAPWRVELHHRLHDEAAGEKR
jgi:hypothetical protein